jgi:hypothetical protein
MEKPLSHTEIGGGRRGSLDAYVKVNKTRRLLVSVTQALDVYKKKAIFEA